LADFVNRCC